MKIKLTILFLLIINTGFSSNFKSNSIGVVYLNSAIGDKYELTFVFPMSSIIVKDEK